MKTGCWPTQGRCIRKEWFQWARTGASSHTQKSTKLLDSGYLVFLNSNLFIFGLPSLCYKALCNPMDRGAWRATVHGVEKSRTRLKRLSTHTHCLHSGCSELSFQHRWRRVLISPHPLQPWFFVECLTMAILTSVSWYLIVVLIWISLIVSKVDSISCVCFLRVWVKHLAIGFWMFSLCFDEHS